MTLEQWVGKQGGIHKTARLLGVTSHSVNSWIKHGNTPRSPLMVKIYKLSKGHVSYQAMVEGTLEVRNAKKRR